MSGIQDVASSPDFGLPSPPVTGRGKSRVELGGFGIGPATTPAKFKGKPRVSQEICEHPDSAILKQGNAHSQASACTDC